MTYHRSGFVPRLTRWVSLVEQELLTLPAHPRFLVGFVFSFICMFCRSLFVLLYFFFGPLCCLFFFYIQILITPLVFSNSSYICFVEQSIFMRIKQPRPVNLFNVGHDLQPKGKLSAQNLSPFQKHYKSCKHSTDVRSS